MGQISLVPVSSVQFSNIPGTGCGGGWTHAIDGSMCFFPLAGEQDAHKSFGGGRLSGHVCEVHRGRRTLFADLWADGTMGKGIE